MCYYFQIIYKPGATNKADSLTQREQDTDKQQSRISVVQAQRLLQPDQLDPRILEELEQYTDICKIDTPESTPESGLDFIDSLLQANCLAESLQEFWEKATEPENNWILEKKLLKYQSCLVVPEEQELYTKIIAEVYNQVSTGYLRKNKTC